MNDIDSLLSSLISEGKKNLTEKKRISRLPDRQPSPEYKPFIPAPQTWHISHLLCIHTNHICSICSDITTHASLHLMEIGPGAALRSTRDIPFGLGKKNIEVKHDYRDETIAFCATCAMTAEPAVLLAHLESTLRPLAPTAPTVDFSSNKPAPSEDLRPV